MAEAGLMMGLALKRKLGLGSTIYEQAPAYEDGVGGAFGLYPNGLKAIASIGGPSLLAAVQSVSQPYQYRRWMRHDGTEVAVASEEALSQDGLQSVGVRRWRLQRAVLNAVEKEGGIKVVMKKKLNRLEDVEGDAQGKVTVVFEDGSKVKADFVFGCDVSKEVHFFTEGRNWLY
ncbi:hypothetical protein HDU93_005509 [Gonapodya sp. JEL0774]|nr:hypothetical protein HDU93_005509 [Gonapodya sp. JEL0774]